MAVNTVHKHTLVRCFTAGTESKIKFRLDMLDNNLHLSNPLQMMEKHLRMTISVNKKNWKYPYSIESGH